jgi:putative glutathione S-transferase
MCGPIHDERSWTFDLDSGGVDPVLGYRRLEQAYLARFADYSRGITVPAMVEIATRQLVTNDPRQITLDLSTEWTEFHREGAPISTRRSCATRSTKGRGADLRRRQRRGLPLWVRRLPALVRAGVRAALRAAGLADQATGRPALSVGNTITEADIRLFTTLVSFDVVYHGHFKANRHKLTEMDVLWAYARDLFQTPGFEDPIDFSQIKRHYYVVHADLNPTQIVPKGPDLSGWLTPHGRELLGGRPFGDGRPRRRPCRTMWRPLRRAPGASGEQHATRAKHRPDTVATHVTELTDR